LLSAGGVVDSQTRNKLSRLDVPRSSRIMAISKYVKKATLTAQRVTRMIVANKDVTSLVPIMGLDV